MAGAEEDVVRVVAVDPAHEPATALQALALGQALQRQAEGELAAPAGEELVRARWADPGLRHALWVALDGDRVVGVAQLRLAVPEPQAPAWLQLGVAPVARRRGIGRALLTAAVGRARDEGRPGVEWVSHRPTPYDGPEETFAHRAGASPAQVALRSAAPVPLAPDVESSVARDVARHSGDYDLIVWDEAVPEPLLADRALLKSRMSTDQPMGTRVAAEESWDEARVRAYEAREAQRGAALSAGAVHRASGRLVAVTDVGVARGRPDVARQGDTLVLREHRGHRLGLAVKLAAGRALAERHPEVRWLTTDNDAANEPMLAVNRALGYRPTGWATIWSLDVTARAPAPACAHPSRT